MGLRFKRFEQLHVYGYPCEVKLAELGCLSVLKHRQRRGHLYPREHLCEAAMSRGQLEVLQWARANGCPWNTNTCFCAAAGGYFEVLQWLRASGCSWDWYIRAAASGPALEWAVANGVPYYNDWTDSETRLFFFLCPIALIAVSAFVSVSVRCLTSLRGRDDLD